ncbi:30S ribosomal protein S4 [Candidatus Gottesmanbacteria bacterium RBG_16_37_8]|uniref:Small ribosomal subunit protein uS4 n=1 Tax=Candidatus Gottesmanbacteria bacterium RBG_16_37_8 TaxID=1798371 RepID=A0A1F5YV76_9BACT|nr:MAG: 30S ribosomal protein S4 [Candidatus Gottesmanbacteria bacterium RBG_16_37_8]
MARYSGPKNRLARREGVDLGLKTPGSKAHSQLLKRLKITPGAHGQKRKRKPSDYGIQLREKQKVKRIYGLLEKQFRKYFQTATRDKRNTGEALLSLLERRLDNCLYRLSLAPTRASARQFITHEHVTVDNKKVDFPSFLVTPGQVIGFKQKMLDNPHIKKMLEIKDPQISSWLTRKGPLGKVVRLPKRDDIAEDINEQLIIEFYSR